ncbi:MAG: hypothetical protein DI535_12110 [Citrobacter freundii]|nr:MAG: hypothetical protein DI535_12110 [Citrobacter freundii]
MCTGEKIKKLRLIKGFSQKGVANHLGVTQQAYSKMEKSHYLSDKRVKDILIFLACTEWEFELISHATGRR